MSAACAGEFALACVELRANRALGLEVKLRFFAIVVRKRERNLRV